MKTPLRTQLSRPQVAPFNRLFRRAARIAPVAALRGSAAVMALFALFGFNPQALAATDTWLGNTSANWADANWSTAPALSGDSLVFDVAGSSGLTLSDNLMTPATYSINGITFSSGASAFVINPATPGTSGFTLGATGDAIINNSANTETINDAIALTGTDTFSDTNGGDLTFGGVISGANDGVNINSGGTVTLDGGAVNSYTGGTNINAGTLDLNFSNLGATANLINSGSALKMSGGTLQIAGNGSSASSQTFAGTTFASGANVVTVAPASGANNPTLTLGALTAANQATGAMVEFVGPATNTSASAAGGTNLSAEAALTSASPGAVLATGTITSTTVGLGTNGSGGSANGLLVNNEGIGYATVGLYDWATTDTASGVAGTSPTTIIGGSQVQGFYTVLNGAVPNGNVTNYDVTGNSTDNSTGNTAQVATMRFNVDAAITVGISTGGGTGNELNISAMLVTPNVQNHNITFTTPAVDGLNVTSHDGGVDDLDVVQNDTLGELIFSQNTHGATNTMINGNTYAQSGAGTVSFLGVNGYVGATYLNGGVTMLNTNSSGAGDELGTFATANLPVNINGGTLLGNFTGFVDNGTHNVTADEHTIVLGTNGGGLAATAGNSMTVDGAVSGAAGTGPLIIGLTTAGALVPGTGASAANTALNATGVVVLSNAGNTYTGGTVLDSGTLQLASGSSLGTGAVTFNGGAFQWGTGNTTDISTAGVTVTSLGGTLDTNGNTVTLGGSIGGAGSLTVTSSAAGGNLILGGANVYTGATNITAGTLTLKSGGSLGNTAITVGTTLAANPGSGNIQIGSTGASLNLPAGASLNLTNGSSNTGTLTLNSAAVNTSNTVLTLGGTTSAPDLFTFGIGSTGADELIVNDGLVSFAGSPQINISLAPFAGAAPSSLLLPLIDAPNASNFSLSDFDLTNPLITNFTGSDYNVTLTLNGTTNELFADLTAAVVNLNYYWTGAQNATWATAGNFATDTTGTQAQTSGPTSPDNVFETGTDAANFSGNYSPQTVGSHTINSLTFTGAVASPVTLQSGTLTINAGTAFTDTNNSNNYAAGIGLVVEAGDAANAISANVNLGASQTWEIDSANALTVSGTIANAPSTFDSLTKTGAGTLILSASNTYTGGTTVSAGKIQLSSGGSVGSVGILTVQGTSTFDLAGNNQTVGGLSDGGVSTGTITSSAGTATLTVSPSVSGTFSGTITDNNAGNGSSLSLAFEGPSIETLSGSNSYTGLTTVSGGTLIATNNHALGSSTSATGGLLLNPASSAAVDFTSATPSIASLASSGGGTSNIVLGNGTGDTATTLTVGGSGATTVFSGVFSDANTAIGAIGNLIVTGGTLTLGGADTFTGSTVINGGTLIIGNSLALQDSTLNYNNQGGVLSFGSQTAATLGGLSGAQNLALTNTNSVAVALTVGDGVADNYTGSLSGAGSLTKVGADALSLANANYTGATTVDAGNLLISAGSVGSATSNVTVAETSGTALDVAGGTLTAGTVSVATAAGQTGGGAEITGSGSGIFTSAVIGSTGNSAGALTINTTGTVSLGAVTVVKLNNGAGANTTLGLVVGSGTVTATSVDIQGDGDKSADLNITGGTLTIGNSSSSGAFKVGDANAGDGGFLTMSGGSLTYLGTDGLLLATLAGTVGDVSITSGTATLTGITLNSGNAASTSALTVGSGATLYLGGVGLVANEPAGSAVSVSLGTATVGAIAPWSSSAPIGLTATTTFQAADSLGNANNISLSGVLSGAGGVAVSGAGSVTLAGANTYTGSTAVNTGGILIVSGSISGTSATTVATGANLEVDGLLSSTTAAAVSGELSGVGSINGATLTSGEVAAGDSRGSTAVGTLTSTGNISLDSNSTLSLRLDLNSTTDADQLAMTNSSTLTLDDSLLQIIVGSGANLPDALDQLYVLVNDGAAGTGSGSDVFSNAPFNGTNYVYTNPNGFVFDVFYATDAANDGTPGNDIDAELIAVPEPGTWASLLGGMGMLIAWQRSRRRRG